MACFNFTDSMKTADQRLGQRIMQRTKAVARSIYPSKSTKAGIVSCNVQPTTSSFNVISGRKLERPDWLQAEVEKVAAVQTSSPAAEAEGAGEPDAPITIPHAERDGEVEFEEYEDWSALVGDDAWSFSSSSSSSGEPADKEQDDHDSGYSDASSIMDAWWTSPSLINTSASSFTIPDASTTALLPVAEPVRLTDDYSSSFMARQWFGAEMLSAPVMMGPQQLEPVAISAQMGSSVMVKKSKYYQTKFVEVGLVDAPIKNE
ncbi:hypothetical protein LTR62_004183 [Meristemomyces frigidus]|uniref:Uncharacterized protein n=1 Tax=Meristemomyces frigidus TaxID=1508187 RepID=A0AAN7TIH8_9PEZI|nr:hypothetical protein LTR62_004183 [Meristemomyces frigidus]